MEVRDCGPTGRRLGTPARLLRREPTWELPPRGALGTDGEQGHPRPGHGTARHALRHPRPLRRHGPGGRVLRSERRRERLPARAGRRAGLRPRETEERDLHRDPDPRRGDPRHAVEALPGGEGQALPGARLALHLDRPRGAPGGRGDATRSGLGGVSPGYRDPAPAGAGYEHSLLGHSGLRVLRPAREARRYNDDWVQARSSAESGAHRACGPAGSTCRTACATGCSRRAISRPSGAGSAWP